MGAMPTRYWAISSRGRTIDESPFEVSRGAAWQQTERWRRITDEAGFYFQAEQAAGQRLFLIVPNHIQLNLRDINQLFNTIDPSPFQERDLDRTAEDFIVSWAHEFPLFNEPIDLIVHLKTVPEGRNAKHLVEQSIHHYFTYRARLNHMEFRRLMKQGQQSLVVGLSFLALCLFVTQFVMSSEHGIVPYFIQQGLTIAGWVAMWRPMEIDLYDWWPLRQRGKVFNKLSLMPVEIRKGSDPDAEMLPIS
jgi:hypothetical protein